MNRALALAVVVLTASLVGCPTAPPDVGGDAGELAIACSSGADCPFGLVCLGRQQRCIPPTSACVTVAGGEAAPVPDGDPCTHADGDGVCVDASCVRSVCGDGVLDPRSEDCDDGNESDLDACPTTCESARCGDGFVQAGVEACDDGNDAVDDACVACRPAECGDGEVWSGVESCDDGNDRNDDGCLTSCELARCGDGFLQAGVETCDDANDDDGDGCPTNCQLARCGDGFLRLGLEVCDDGGNESGDGCRADCGKLEVCGDGELDAAESCDDGNVNDNDRCSSSCTPGRWSIGPDFGPTLDEVLAFGRVAVIAPALQVAAVPDANQLVMSGRTCRIGTGNAALTDGDESTIAFASPRGVDARIVGTDIILTVADSGNHAVRWITDPAGFCTGLLSSTLTGGNGRGFSDGDPSVAQFDRPSDVAHDVARDAVYVADTNNHAIRRVDLLTGETTTLAGGEAGLVDGALADARFRGPVGLGLGDDGALYVADHFNDAIRRIDIDAGTVETLTSGSLLRPEDVDAASRDRVFIAHQGRVSLLSSLAPTSLRDSPAPSGMDLHSGFLYVSDRVDGNIVRVEVTGSVVTGEDVILGRRPPAPADLQAGIPGTSRPVIPRSLASGSLLYFAESDLIDALRGLDSGGTLQHTDLSASRGSPLPFIQSVAIRQVGSETVYYLAPWVEEPGLDEPPPLICLSIGQDFVETSIAPPTDTGFVSATALALEGDGTLWVADEAGGAVWRIPMSPGMPCSPAAGATARVDQGAVLAPSAIAFDAGGSAYVADVAAHAVVRFDLSGWVPEVWAGGNGPGYLDIQEAFYGQLNRPRGLAFDSTGVLYIADQANHAVRRVDPHPTDPSIAGSLTTFVGDGLPGPTGDGGFASAARLNNPHDVLWVGDTLYVGDGVRLRQVDSSGVITTAAGAIDPQTGARAVTHLPDAAAVEWLDADRRLVVADTHLVLVDSRGASRVVVGHPYPSPAPVLSPARHSPVLSSGRGIALDAAGGRAWVSEAGAHVIREVTLTDPADPSSWQVSDALGVRGEPGWIDTDGPAAAARLSAPHGLAYAPAENALYVADTGNHVVRRWDFLADTVVTVIGSGFAGSTDDGFPATLSELDGPEDVAVGPRGGLFVADTGNARVRRVDPADGLSQTVIGTGVAVDGNDGPFAAAASISPPRGIDVDGFGNLYVSTGDRLRQVVAGSDSVASGEDRVLTLFGLGGSGYEVTRVGLTGVAVRGASAALLDGGGGTGILLEWGAP